MSTLMDKAKEINIEKIQEAEKKCNVETEEQFLDLVKKTDSWNRYLGFLIWGMIISGLVYIYFFR